jgi:predicted AAA+ superfamily ATPase
MSDQMKVIDRHVATLVRDLMAEEPVVLLTGPRTSGKSTVARAVAERHQARLIDLDDPLERQAAASNPTLFIEFDRPVVIDEFQYAPELVSAVKASLNADLRPGRFLLTGSSRWQSIPEVARHLTGRAHPVTLWPFSQGEMAGHRERFLDALATGHDFLDRRPAQITRSELLDRATSGGYPLAVARSSPSARSRWFTSLVELIVSRDATGLRAVRQPEQLERVLRLLAARTASVLNANDLARDADMSGDTAGELIRLLEAIYLVIRVPAWSENLNARVSHRPKIHLGDPGLASHLLRLSPATLARPTGATLARLGQLLETFAATEILRQASWRDPSPSVSHFRTRDGLEVDLVIEHDDGSVAGVEVKAASRITNADGRGLRYLRDRFGSRFTQGVILCTVDAPLRLDDRVTAVPFDRLWTT